MTVTQYLGQDVPEDIQLAWNTVEGARWRIRAHLNNNELYPPTQHINVTTPASLCELHRSYWIQWRNREFDPVSGNRWPGNAESPFSVITSNIAMLREERRAEWDRKALDAMEFTEAVCATGKSCEYGTPMTRWYGDGYRRWKSDNGPVTFYVSGYCPSILRTVVADGDEEIEFTTTYPNDREAKRAAREEFYRFRREGLV